MTIIVSKDRVLYVDSKVTTAGDVKTENCLKIIPVTNATWENDEEIIAIAGAGIASQIDKITALLANKGYDRFLKYNEMVDAKLAMPVNNFALFLMCTHYVYLVNVNPKTNKLITARFSHDEMICEGSGRHAHAIAAELLNTDAVGTVCAAIALDSKCGGFIRSYDTKVKNPKIVSVYYKYPKLRIVWGMLKVRFNKWRFKLLAF